jgi:hypothetical protein
MNKTKRTLLKYGGLAWVTPMVTSVSLPAHAQTSGISCASDLDSDLLLFDVLGVWSFTDANGLEFEILFTKQEDGNYEFDLTADDAEAYYGRGSRTSGSMEMDFEVYGNGSNNYMYFSGDITSFTNCVALEITVTNIRSIHNPRGYAAPIIGVRSS